MSLALCLLVNVAHAQAGDTATADRLFREGRALLKQGNYEEACSKLEESHRLDPAPGTAINLGDCFENLGKVASALLAYQAARDLLQATDPRLAPVRQQISLLQKRVPHLLIRLARGSPPKTSVTRDGRKAEPDSRVTVNPGKHVIIVTAPGREKASYKVTLVEGESRTMTVEAGEPEEQADTGSARRSERDARKQEPASGSMQRAMGFVACGAGTVALAVGGILWLGANSTEQEATDAGCTDSTCPAGRAQELSDEADEKRRAANWSTGLGVLALATGVVLVVTSPAGEQTAARLRVAPSMVVGGGGARVGGVW